MVDLRHKDAGQKTNKKPECNKKNQGTQTQRRDQKWKQRVGTVYSQYTENKGGIIVDGLYGTSENWNQRADTGMMRKPPAAGATVFVLYVNPSGFYKVDAGAENSGKAY